MKSKYKQVSLVVFMILIAIIIFEISCKQLGAGKDKQEEQKAFSIMALYKTVTDAVSGGIGGGYIEPNREAKALKIAKKAFKREDITGKIYTLGYFITEYLSTTASRNNNTPYKDSIPGVEAHAGIDLRVENKSSDGRWLNPVYAIEDGIVKNDPSKSSSGAIAVYNSAKKWTLFYLHLESITVKQGDEITVGTELGLGAKFGLPPDDIYIPHLHLELQPGEKTIPIYSGSCSNKYCSKDDVSRLTLDPITNLLLDEEQNLSDIKLNSYNLKIGELIKINWSKNGVVDSAKLKISIKRDSSNNVLGSDYYVFTESTDNDGEDSFIIPNNLTPASDWRVYLKIVDSGKYISSNVVTITAITEPSTGGGSTLPGGGNTSLYTVGGSLSGVKGTVVLQNNGGNDLQLTADGSFTFSTSIASGGYSVTIKTNPSGQTCTVTNGSGNISSANVTNVSVTCATIITSHTVGGSLSGLTGTLVLQNNASNDLPLTADGSFTFSTSIASGSAYSVTVKTNPVGQTCTVTNGSGNISSANVTNVSVTCSKSCGVVDVTDGTSKHIAKGLNGNIFIGGKNSTGFFVSKINNNCQVVITKNITAPNSNYGNFHGIKLDSTGNIYIIGDIQCSNGSNFEGTSCTGNSQDIFLVKYDSNFTKLFSKIFADTSVYEIGYGLEVDSIGNSYVYYNKGTTIYLVKYSSDGNSQVFNKNLQNECTGNSSFSYGDIFVSGSNIFLTGTTNCSTFNGVNNPNNINPTMKDNYFILKANSSDGVFTQTIMHPYSSGYEKRYYGLSIYAASNSAYISAWGYPSSTEGTIMFAKHDLSNGNLLWENFIFHGSSDKPSSIISSNNTFIVIGNTLGAYYDSYKPASRALYFHKYDLNGLVSKKLLSVPTDFDAQNAILDDQGFLNIVWKYQNKVKYGIFDTEGNLK